MSGASLELEILVPDGTVVRAPAREVRGQDASGRFGLRPGHEAFVTILEPGVLEFVAADGSERFAAVDGGVLLLERDRVQVVTRDAAAADSLQEVADKAAAMLAARRDRERAAGADFAELEATLLRELNKSERGL